MEIIQLANQVVDINDWIRDEQSPYPKGARKKQLIYSPSIVQLPFLKPNHKYIFKLTPDRCPDQFWVEIFAYRLGMQMEVPVPPTYAAFDNNQSECGALVEWYLKTEGGLVGREEEEISGSDIFQSYIPGYDTIKGRQHNFEKIAEIFTSINTAYPESYFDWKEYWAKTLVFDSIIGNTDRHQGNWTIIRSTPVLDKNFKFKKIRPSPAFDNGSSMGYEQPSENFASFEDINNIKKYVLKGRHHMKWQLKDPKKAQHGELLKKLAELYPETRQIMLTCLKQVKEGIFESILNELIAFDISVRLSTERAEFMLKLIMFRHKYLLSELE